MSCASKTSKRVLGLQSKCAASPGFGWSSHETNGWWKIIQQNVQTVKDAGFTHIWLPPPSRSVAPQVSCKLLAAQDNALTKSWTASAYDEGFGWDLRMFCNWVPGQRVPVQGYMPGQYYNLNSSYGSPDELRAAVAEIKKAGLAPMCDIVINHRCADSQDDSGVWNKYE